MQDWETPAIAAIPAGRHFRIWWFLLPVIVGVLSLIAAAFGIALREDWSVLLLALAAVCVVWIFIAGGVILLGRRSIEPLPDGFRIFDRHGVREFRDEQVTDLMLCQSMRHAGGKAVGETHRLTVWVAGDWQTQCIPLECHIPLHGPDPLQVLVDRLCAQALKLAEAALAGRGTLSGAGWKLENEELHIESRRSRQVLPLASLAAIEQIGQDVRIWRMQQPTAIASLPLSTRNTWILEPLLSGHIEGRHLSLPRDKPSNSDLGRVLFERRSGPVGVILCGVTGVALGVLACVFVWLGFMTQDVITLGVGLVLGLLGSTCLFAGMRLRKLVLRCHERGLQRVMMTGSRTLPFEAVEVFSFEKRRNYSHGRYTGTTYTVVFADRSREIGDGIFYSTTVRNRDEELEEFRDRAATHIARRMARTFARHRHVQWTPELWFRGTALEYVRKRRWFGPSTSVLVPLNSITDFEVREGLFYIWTNSQERAAATIKTSSPNFYAGLVLFESLVSTHPHETAEMRSIGSEAK